MQRPGHADLPLHGGHVPAWLADRMTRLGTAIAETILLDYGHSQLLSHLSDPFWFQALGCVMGMDWHSSGIPVKSFNEVTEMGVVGSGKKVTERAQLFLSLQSWCPPLGSRMSRRAGRSGGKRRQRSAAPA